MALLKSKAAKAAAMTDATRLLNSVTATDSAFEVSATPGSTADWSISQLSAIYKEHRTQLVSQARRITRDEAEANEVVQEAFLKFMLASPELDSADRAIAYLRTSVTNLSLNVIRARGARPNLVAIDANTTQERLNEIASENHVDLDTTIAAAEDAAVIREALSRLTSDQRTALVMWEMEGRSTQEIATALNTSPANVRHILIRARKSMVRVLEDWVIDEATGLTALNALSTTYKKAAKIAQKSSKAALSLLLVITAFLGFNSMSGNEGSPLAILSPEIAVVSPASPQESASQSPTAIASAVSTGKAKAAATIKAKAAKTIAAAAATKRAQTAALSMKIAALSFFGLDKDGLPTAFTVTDSKNIEGIARLTKGTSSVGTGGIVINNQFITGSVGPNVLIDQVITIDGTGTRYSAKSISIGWGGNWNSVEITSHDSSIDRLSNGKYMITSTFTIGYLNESIFQVPTGGRGFDLADAPKSITTRILLNAGKTTFLAQAVQVNN
ncbi:MAG: RNA polymerase sigma factor [Candidatus Planktophila sp.]|nr:RNA polymerase sigma factor [Candidatus Planktophila sp.]